MISPPNQEYNKILCTPVVLEGPRKNAIDAIQKKIDLHFKQINELRSAQNSHVPVSSLPAELLSEVFLCIVESGLLRNNLGLTAGTFEFRLVCKYWNDVAVECPQLWVRWTPRAVRVWPLFNTRSKGAPISLTWRPYHIPASGRDVLADPTIPGRIQQLNFSGTSEELEQLFGAFDSSPPSNASSIQVHITLPFARQATKPDTQEHLARFLSSSFPKLSKLDIYNYQPDSSSSVFATSNLTSLKLSFPYTTRPRYTLAQLSRILQKHPNLRELDLKDGAMPQVESADAPVPSTLSQLTDLELGGTVESILGLVNLIGTSSPLLNVAFHFSYHRNQNVPVLVDAVKKILAAYYECEGLDHPRKANNLIVSEDRGTLYFVARSRSAPASTPQPTLELQFSRANELLKIFPLFPLKDTRELTLEGVTLSSNEYYTMLRKVKGVSRLHLSKLDIGPVLEALDPRNRGKSAQQPVHKLVSLTLSDLDFLLATEQDMLAVLQGRRDCKVGLERLIIQRCRVRRANNDTLGFKELVGKVEWINVDEMGSYYDGSDEDPDSDESDYPLNEYDLYFF